MAIIFRGGMYYSYAIPAALVIVIMILLFNPTVIRRNTKSDGAEHQISEKKIIISSVEDKNIFSTDELNYFDTGNGDPAKFQSRLPVYIRTRIAEPRHYKPAAEWTRKDFSQFGQSQALEGLLRNRTNGFFVECGAHDGLEASNTAFLELARNWTGLLVEGDPRVYPRMLSSGRRTYMLPHCLSPQDKPFRANFRIAGGFQGLSDFFRLHKEPDKNTLRETLVTCFPFNAIMDALGIRHVDFFSLDVEGAELEILQTIDFKKIKIDLFLIEFAYTPLEQKQKESQERLEKYRAFFNATGLYKEVAILNYPGINLGLDVAFRRIDFV